MKVQFNTVNNNYANTKVSAKKSSGKADYTDKLHFTGGEGLTLWQKLFGVKSGPVIDALKKAEEAANKTLESEYFKNIYTPTSENQINANAAKEEWYKAYHNLCKTKNGKIKNILSFFW